MVSNQISRSLRLPLKVSAYQIKPQGLCPKTRNNISLYHQWYTIIIKVRSDPILKFRLAAPKVKTVMKVLYFQLTVGFGLIIALEFSECAAALSVTVVLINLADKFIIFHAQCKLWEKSFRLIYKVARKVAFSSQEAESYPKKQVFKLRVKSLLSKEAAFLFQLYHCIDLNHIIGIVYLHPSSLNNCCTVSSGPSITAGRSDHAPTAQNISLLGRDMKCDEYFLQGHKQRDIHQEHFIWQSLAIHHSNEKSAKFKQNVFDSCLCVPMEKQLKKIV